MVDAKCKQTKYEINIYILLIIILLSLKTLQWGNKSKSQHGMEVIKVRVNMVWK